MDSNVAYIAGYITEYMPGVHACSTLISCQVHIVFLCPVVEERRGEETTSLPKIAASKAIMYMQTVKPMAVATFQVSLCSKPSSTSPSYFKLLRSCWAAIIRCSWATDGSQVAEDNVLVDDCEEVLHWKQALQRTDATVLVFLFWR